MNMPAVDIKLMAVFTPKECDLGPHETSARTKRTGRQLEEKPRKSAQRS